MNAEQSPGLGYDTGDDSIATLDENERSRLLRQRQYDVLIAAIDELGDGDAWSVLKAATFNTLAAELRERYELDLEPSAEP